MKQDRTWRVDTYRMEHDGYGTFFVTAQPDGRAMALRVWGDAAMVAESIGVDGVSLPATKWYEFADADAAKRACEARIARLDGEYVRAGQAGDQAAGARS